MCDRYFFITTQDEIVVFRVRRLDVNKLADVPEDNKHKLYADFEYKSIPWGANGEGCVNSNLAIWALRCMGMNDNHREMERPEDESLEGMVRLTHWIEDSVNGQYTNVI